MLAGGALLMWIAYRLLTDDAGDRDREIGPAMGFWAAMRTIVVADAVMGLDNVLAVAGAAHGSILLVVLGLVISIPIVVWGSTVILKWMERFPSLLYAGGAVLAWTAATMILGEPRIASELAERPLFRAAIYVAVIAGVLGLALARNRRAVKEATQ
jgi:YjbE family integral membrane protein